MAGLQDIAPTVANRWVSSAVLRAHPGRRSRGLAAGVAAADHDDVEGIHGKASNSGAFSRASCRVKMVFHVKLEPFHVKQRNESNYFPMQKSRKITSRISSTSTRPVSRPRVWAARPQLFGDQFFASVLAFCQSTVERISGRIQCFSMPFSAQKRRFRPKYETAYSAKCGQKIGQSQARRSRKTKNNIR